MVDKNSVRTAIPHRLKIRSLIAVPLVTTIANTPFEITVYKVGDKYVAARSNEFGYANYQVE